MEHQDALNEDFNLSTAEGTTVRQLAELIWRKVKGEGVPLRLIHDNPFHTTSSAGCPTRMHIDRQRRSFSTRGKCPSPYTRKPASRLSSVSC